MLADLGDFLKDNLGWCSPGRRCPCLRSGQSSCTWVCCTCSYLERPGVCEQRSRSFPLEAEHTHTHTHTLPLLTNTKKCSLDAEKKLSVTGGLTSPPPELDLVPLEVGLVLHHFNKTLQEEIKTSKQENKRRLHDRLADLLCCVVELSVSELSVDRANMS